MTGNPRRAFDANENEIEPMRLGGMRSLGVHSLDAYCLAVGCGHEGTLDADGLPDEVAVPRCRLAPALYSMRRPQYPHPARLEPDAGGGDRETLRDAGCQTASKTDPRSASNFDPLISPATLRGGPG